MALDEPRDTDQILDDEDLTFLMDRPLFEIAKPIRIDYESTETGGEYTISCAIAENNCSIAEDPSACHASCSI